MSVLTLGECFIHAVKHADGSWQHMPAGYMLNVSVALRRLGRTVRFVTDFGLDADGTLLTDYLAAHSVELWLREDAQRNNPTSVLTSLATGEELLTSRPGLGATSPATLSPTSIPPVLTEQPASPAPSIPANGAVNPAHPIASAHPNASAGPLADAMLNEERQPAVSNRLDFTWDIQDTPVSGACVLDLEMLAPRSVAFGGAGCHTAPGAAKVRHWVEQLRETTSVFYHLGLPPGFAVASAQLRKQTEAFVPLTDVVCTSRKQMAQLYGGKDMLTVARHWQELGAALVVITDDDGASFIPRVGGPLRVQALARPVDAAGADEAFFAALIDGISRASLDGPHGKTTLQALTGEALEALGSYATAAAAVAASRTGVYPPSREEVISVSEARQVSDEPITTAV